MSVRLLTEKEIERSANKMAEAIRLCGGVLALGEKTGLSRYSIYNYSGRRNVVPLESALRIEIATSGKVTASDLRPDCKAPIEKYIKYLGLTKK